MGETALVLIPGAGMSSWIWERVEGKFLVPAIDIPDRFDVNNYPMRKHGMLNDCVEHIRGVLDRTEYRRFIVVGHSGAGPIAAKVASTLKERVVHVVYVAANLPAHGKTMLDSLPWMVRMMNLIAIRKMVKRDSMPYKRVEKIVREKFCNDSAEDVIALMLSKQMRSEPLCAITERMDWEGFPDVPQTYFVLTRDQTGTVERQKTMAGNLKIKNLVEIASDHMVMLSHPEEFVRELNVIARQYL